MPAVPPRGPAFELNSEAGTHHVTADPAELKAVQEAAEITWTAFPYYERRFGERGRRFCLSDSAWVTTLCDAPARAREHVRWLGGVLSSRGMPQILLETHLVTLHRALYKSLPEQRSRYRPISTAARALRRSRCAIVPEEEFRRLGRAFDRAVADLPEAIPNAGDLLVSATIDETSGIEAAVPSLLEFMADARRFSGRWIAAVEETVARSRAAIRRA